MFTPLPYPEARGSTRGKSTALGLGALAAVALPVFVLLDGIALKTVGAVLMLAMLSAFAAHDARAKRRMREEAAAAQARFRELEEANRLLRLTETTAQVGHWRLTLADNAVYWSDGCCAIHGVDPDDPDIPPPLGEAIEFFHPDDRHIVESAVEISRETGEPFTFHARLIRADGEVRHTMSTSLVETDENGEATALFGVFCDRTEEETMQRELRAARNNADALANARSS
ncbi:MAG: PAS domain-containing protein, partial [Pseudomonadota bacterium]